MEYQLVIPAEMTVEFLVDELAHAVWNHLADDPASDELLPVHFGAIHDSIQDHLMERLESDQHLGWVRSLRFTSGTGDTDASLEDELTRVVAQALGAVLSDDQSIRILLPGLPAAIRNAFTPYLDRGAPVASSSATAPDQDAVAAAEGEGMPPAGREAQTEADEGVIPKRFADVLPPEVYIP